MQVNLDGCISGQQFQTVADVSGIKAISITMNSFYIEFYPGSIITSVELLETITKMVNEKTKG